MYSTNLRKVGGSIMMAVPPAILNLLQLHAGATVGLTVDRGHLLVIPTRRPSYRLEELLAQCDSSSETSLEDYEWLDSKPVAKELL